MSDEREETEEEKRARRAVQFGTMRKFRHGEADEQLLDVQYWLSRSVGERLEAIEILREAHWGGPGYSERFKASSSASHPLVFGTETETSP
ncbi:hypothetical protein GC173_00515 [bacterium]|nr:hypothetical protein [bacterium]